MLDFQSKDVMISGNSLDDALINENHRLNSVIYLHQDKTVLSYWCTFQKPLLPPACGDRNYARMIYFWFVDAIIFPIRGAFPREFFNLATLRHSVSRSPSGARTRPG